MKFAIFWVRCEQRVELLRVHTQHLREETPSELPTHSALTRLGLVMVSSPVGSKECLDGFFFAIPVAAMDFLR